MSLVEIVCCHCEAVAQKKAGAVKRAHLSGLRLYCGRKCSGLGRRKEISREQKVAEKSQYDRKRRERLADEIKAKKHEYFKRTYDPKKAAIERKANMARHVAYCRRPEYKAYKTEYDKAFRAKKYFGEFWEAAILLNSVESEVLSSATRYDIDLQNGKLNKATRRKRQYEQGITFGS